MGIKFELKDVSFEIDTKKAIVSVTSLDNQAINESSNILITAIARVHSSEGEFPFLSEPVSGSISIKALPGLTLTKVRGAMENGVSFVKSLGSLPTEYRDGKYFFKIDNSAETHWFVLGK